jgi:anti-sigma B factor antagonist
MFRFDKQQREGWLLLDLEGNLDAATATTLKPEVVAIEQAKQLKVVVDLSKLTLIDSTGVGVLISLFKRLRALEGQVFFAGLNSQPKEIFRLLRLDRSLDLFPSVNEARERGGRADHRRLSVVRA